MTTARMPVGFVGHGSPMHGLGSPLADSWRAWGWPCPRPESVLVVSAHFEAAPPTLSSTTGAGLIYDFGGFPEEMYRLEYPAPPAPHLAAAVERLLGRDLAVGRAEDRGLDHGAWVPLLHMYPEHDVPVVQLSIPLDGESPCDAGSRVMAWLRCATTVS